MRTLTAETVYSASLFDHDAIHTVIKKVCDIDHLPDNTLHGRLLLRDAWDAIDVYNHLARHSLRRVVLGIPEHGRADRARHHLAGADARGEPQVYGQPVKVDDDDYELQQCSARTKTSTTCA